MRQPVPALEMSAGQREVLESLARSQSGAHREVVRAKALLMAADGVANTAIAGSLSVSPASVKSWRERFTEEGLAKLGQVRKGRGRKPSIPQSKIDEILDLTQNYRPRGETHWSCRTMAAAAGVSKSTVQVVWHARGLKPHRVKTFKLSNDPRFEEKLIDIVGLYMNPPEKAIVLCADEKYSVQALDRTQASLPMVKGRGETMTHDLQAARHHHLVRCPGRVDRHGDRTMYAAPPASGVVEVPQDHRPRGARRPGDPSDLRQLRHPQTQRRPHMAGQSSSVPPAFHPDILILVEPGGTVVSRTNRQGVAARGISFRSRPDRLNPGIHRLTQ